VAQAQPTVKSGAEEYRDAFDIFDTDGDGRISATELQNVMSNLGVECTVKQAQGYISEVTKDGAELITYDEFSSLLEQKSATGWTIADNDLLEAFAVFDTDGDMKVTRDEVREVMKKFGEVLDDDSLQSMIDEVDADHDGIITFEEFKKIMTHQSDEDDEASSCE